MCPPPPRAGYERNISIPRAPTHSTLRFILVLLSYLRYIFQDFPFLQGY